MTRQDIPTFSNPPSPQELAAAIFVLQTNFRGTDPTIYPKNGQWWLTEGSDPVMRLMKSDGSGYMEQIMVATFPVAGFDAAGTFTLGAMPNCIIVGAYVVSSAATTSDGSNLYTLQLRNATAAVDLGAAATTTNGADIAVNTGWRITTDQNLSINSGEVLTLVVTETGTGTDLTTAQIRVSVFYKLSA